jgi:O-antigen ligase
MIQSNGLASAVEPPSARRTLLQNVELICFVLFALNRIVGVLDPPEAFLLDPLAYSNYLGSSSGGVGRTYPLTTPISQLSEVFTLFLLVRHWQAYLGIIRRSPLVFVQMLMIIGSTFWSISPTDSLRSSLHYVIDYVIALHIVYSYSAMGFAALLVRLSAVGAAVSFILLAAFPSLSHELAVGSYAAAWRGAYENKNFLGATAAISTVVACYSLLTGANDRRFAFLVMLANMVLLVGSRSSTSLVATVVCLAILCAVGTARKPGGVICTATVALGGLCLLSAALVSVHDPFALFGKDSTLTGRTAVWHAVMPLIRQRLLHGYGLGFWDVDSNYRNDVWTAANWDAPHAHNDYLDVILQTGLVSFFVCVINYAICIFWSLRSIWRIKEGSLLYLTLILIYMIRGLSETVIVGPATAQLSLIYVAETSVWLLAFPLRGSPVANRAPANRPLAGIALRP